MAVCTINDIPIFYEEYGAGKPVLCLHGYTLDHRMMSGCLEPVFLGQAGYRRIYLDLPGMGKTPAAKSIKTAHDVLELLHGFIGELIPGENFLLAGESFGGYLSLGLLHEIGARIDGLLLICPQTMTWRAKEARKEQERWRLPERQMIYQSIDLSPEEDPDFKGFMDFAVVATPEIYARHKQDILAGVKLADIDFLYNYFDGGFNDDFEAELKTMEFLRPSCILTGRQDHAVGYLDSFELLKRFPRASYATLDGAGHNLQTENEPLFQQFVKDWLWRVELAFCKP
jgi:pimeloyl-ACP methyl ester carboxylesterase